ncbi:MAG: N-acetylmuramoyl-L-alanine amidase family protein [Limisphaerales bacterium]|jgi:N-acetylmuramoyl-L-alanine amidase
MSLRRRNLNVISAAIICLLIYLTDSEAAYFKTTTLLGREYVNLADFARSKNLEYTFNFKSGEATLKSRWSNLLFTADSNKATINGVNVWLSFPVARKGNDFYISNLDILTAVEPILQPPRASTSEKVLKVCLDPGHGGKDPGNIEGRHYEKDYTLMLSFEVKRQLEKEGFKVVMTRSSDRFVDLSERPQIANRAGAHIFVSIHFNASDSKSVKGIETFCMTPENADSTNARGGNSSKGRMTGNRNDTRNMYLAYCIQKSLSAVAQYDDRGVKRARFAVLKDCSIPAVLVECGFMSSAEDMRKISDVAWRKQIARGIVEGIKNYQKQVSR